MAECGTQERAEEKEGERRPGRCWAASWAPRLLGRGPGEKKKGGGERWVELGWVVFWAGF